MIKTGNASNKEEAVKLFDVITMLKKKSYNVKVDLELSDCPGKIAYAILTSGAVPNIIKLIAMDPTRTVAIRHVKPQRLHSVAGTSLRVTESIWIVKQLGQRVDDTGILVVKNLALGIHLGTAFVDANVKSIAIAKQMIYPIRSSPVTIKVQTSRLPWSHM